MTFDDGKTVQLEVKKAEKPRPVFGSGKGWFTDMSDDFDAPLEDFKDYTDKPEPGPQPGARERGLVGSAKGKIQMADDFDEPLADFKEYTE